MDSWSYFGAVGWTGVSAYSAVSGANTASAHVAGWPDAPAGAGGDGFLVVLGRGRLDGRVRVLGVEPRERGEVVRGRLAGRRGGGGGAKRRLDRGRIRPRRPDRPPGPAGHERGRIAA